MNNKKTSSKFIKRFATGWLLALTLFVLSVVVKTDVPEVAPYVFGALTVLIAFAFARGGYHYVEFETDKEFIRIKYFNLFPVGREYKAVQIPWSRYHKHEITTSLGGMFSFIHIYEETGRGMARYPGVGLTAMTREEKTQLLQFFEKITRKK
jgi:hypothetical protein